MLKTLNDKMNGLLLLLLAVGLNATATTTAEQRPMLQCHIEAPAEVALGKALKLKFKLTNTTAKPLKVLKWNTPLEGAWLNSSFNLTRDGQWVKYTGAMVRRFRPDDDDYIAIAAGASVAQTVNMADAYQLHKPGVYKLVFEGYLQDVQQLKPQQPPSANRQAHKINCNQLQVTIK